ncbi:MAG: right-handed parallel beta-helix repeat-containing protein, partial [Candidatus Margulisiibacteriota bacterium]
GYTSFILTIVGKDDPTTSGNITVDTTWKKSQSPILIQSDVCVQNGATLTIEPGVEVRFLGAYALKIHGTLIAKGTDTEKITFTSDKKEPGSWQCIYFAPGSNGTNYMMTPAVSVYPPLDPVYESGSIISNCVIEYAGAGGNDGNLQDGTYVGYTAAITCYYSAPYIYKNEIKNNAKDGIDIICSSYCIFRNTIVNNEWNGMDIKRSSGTICRNSIENNTMNGISINTFNQNSTIIYNDILGNKWSGIDDTSSNDEYTKVTISNNNIKNNSKYGIYRFQGRAYVTYNNILGNGKSQYCKFTNEEHYYSPGVISHRDTNADLVSSNYWGTSNSDNIESFIYNPSNINGYAIPVSTINYLPIETSEITNAGPQ